MCDTPKSLRIAECHSVAPDAIHIDKDLISQGSVCALGPPIVEVNCLGEHIYQSKKAMQQEKEQNRRRLFYSKTPRPDNRKSIRSAWTHDSTAPLDSPIAKVEHASMMTLPNVNFDKDSILFRERCPFPVFREQPLPVDGNNASSAINGYSDDICSLSRSFSPLNLVPEIIHGDTRKSKSLTNLFVNFLKSDGKTPCNQVEDPSQNSGNTPHKAQVFPPPPADMIQKDAAEVTPEQESLSCLRTKIFGSFKKAPATEQPEAVVSTQPNRTINYTVKSTDSRLGLAENSLASSISGDRGSLCERWWALMNETFGLVISFLLVFIWITILVFAIEYVLFLVIELVRASQKIADLDRADSDSPRLPHLDQKWNVVGLEEYGVTLSEDTNDEDLDLDLLLDGSKQSSFSPRGRVHTVEALSPVEGPETDSYGQDSSLETETGIKTMSGSGFEHEVNDESAVTEEVGSMFYGADKKRNSPEKQVSQMYSGDQSNDNNNHDDENNGQNVSNDAEEETNRPIQAASSMSSDSGADMETASEIIDNHYSESSQAPNSVEAIVSTDRLLQEGGSLEIVPYFANLSDDRAIAGHPMIDEINDGVNRIYSKAGEDIDVIAEKISSMVDRVVETTPARANGRSRRSS